MTTTMLTGTEPMAAPAEASAHHAEPENNHALVLSLVFFGWIVALLGAFVLFGLGGVITVATLSAWGMLALLVVMTAGG